MAENTNDKKLFLLDAFALIFRAYYALIRNPRVTSTGKNTNAQFVFTNTLYELIRKENPTHLAVVFDTAAPTERHTDFADYKANRDETPEDLKAAIPDIKRIIEGFNIPVMECDGYEADDVIGGLAYEASDMGYEVYMVTPDKDYGQLVRDNIFIYNQAIRAMVLRYWGQKESVKNGISNGWIRYRYAGAEGRCGKYNPRYKGRGPKNRSKPPGRV